MMDWGYMNNMEKPTTAYWGTIARQAITDEQAFSQLYDYFFPRVYQYLLGRTKDSSLADELVSDTFIRMFKYLKEYDPAKGAFSTWLFRIAQNVLYKHYGGKEQQCNAPWNEEFNPAAPAHENPDSIVLSQERNQELKWAMEQLPERQQKILEMTYWLDMKSNEIGEVLGMAPSSVRVALKQARDTLKQLLEKKSG